METQKPSKYNQLQNVNTVWWESGNVSSQALEINDRKSEVIGKTKTKYCIKL